MALCMTVNPGWGGQAFIAHSLDKLPRVRAIVGDGVAVEVDGGVSTDTAASCRAAGANVFVAGSAIFASGDPGAAYRAIAQAAQAS
jgi:ribulose-phosphate 3-epimerase